MGDTKTEQNLREAFTGEAKAYIRLLAFAKRADQDDYKQVAKLFRSIAESEKIHANNHLNLLDVVKDTDENLRISFEKETFINEVAYPDFIQQAEVEGNQRASMSFSRTRDVEKRHAKLYEQAMQHFLSGEETDYYVCSICGYIADHIVPDTCPVCGARKEFFKKID